MKHNFLKRARQKLLSPVLAELDITKQIFESRFKELEQKYDLLASRIDELYQYETQGRVGEVQLRADFEKELIVAQIKQRWELIDEFHELHFAHHTFTCSICGHEINTDSAKKYFSECIFHGGHLERYECDHCGCIIGPLKMFQLNKEAFDLDYEQHYSIFSEGDTTEAEKFTFYQLKPDKNKVYLNYGCGAWSRSIDELRAEGYQVYGFEPYAQSENPFIISSFDELKQMKFDGIFTNNLLEHLPEPIEAFELFKSLLRDKTCLMIHSTPCYEYLYEYTRFHLFFFTGKSVDYLCEKVGLEAIDRHETEQFDGTYISYCYRIK